jgi:hypothetical protein
VLVWTSTERGEGRLFTGSTLVLAQGPRALVLAQGPRALVLAQGPRALWRRSTLVCSSSKGGLSQVREKVTDILPESQPSAPGSILRGNLEPTPCHRREPLVVA